MCGRTAQGLEPAQIREDLAKTLPKVSNTWIGEDKYRTSYNVAPTRYQPVVRADATTGEYVVHMMKWGLIPRTTKAMPDYKSVLKSINARDDSLFTGPTGKPMFSHSKNHKRCIVLAQGFFEWRRRGKERVPFYTHRRDGHLMLMAGIYDVATIQGFEEPVYSYATITTNASPQLAWLHDRMPVLISNHDHEAIRAWLDPHRKWDAQLEAMLRPCAELYREDEHAGPTDQGPEYILETYQVSGDVNNIRFDKKEFIEPWNTKDNMKTLARFLMPTSNTSMGAKGRSSPFLDVKAKKQEDDDEQGEDINDQLLDHDARDIDIKKEGGEEEKNDVRENEEMVRSKLVQPPSASAEDGANTDDDDGGGGADTEHEGDMDISMIKDDPDITMESITHHLDNDDNDENDSELQRILELSRQEHETETPGSKRKRTLGQDANQDHDHEEDDDDDEFQRALEASRLQAIADGHDDESFALSNSSPLSSQPKESNGVAATEGSSSQEDGASDEAKEEALRRREQEDLDRAIAASLSEASSPAATTGMANPFLVTSSLQKPQDASHASSGSSHKKRRVSAAGGSGGNSGHSVTSSPSGKTTASDVTMSPGSRTPRKAPAGSKHPPTPGDPSIPKITSFFRKTE